MILFLICLILLLACWGSFLNFLAYRLVHDVSFAKPRSICPTCHYQIAWFDLIPIISWLNLRGICRNCRKPISKLYPAIELATILIGLALVYFCNPIDLPAYFIFSSALLIVIRTDLQTMLISRFTTLFLIPVPIILSLAKFNHQPLLAITITQVLSGIFLGYTLLFLINKIAWLITKQDGLGQGDIDLLTMIGAFTGAYGVWLSLMIGSILGSIIGVTLIYAGKSKLQTKIPFGPFLAVGAIIYILFQNQLLALLFT